jgi:hypothetical protein
VSKQLVLVDGAVKDAANVVATKQGSNLNLKFADGTELQVENYYTECAGNACSISVAGKEAGGHIISADAATGAAAADGSQLAYAHGEQTSLMAMASGDSTLSSALGKLGEGMVSYLPEARCGRHGLGPGAGLGRRWCGGCGGSGWRWVAVAVPSLRPSKRW